MLKRRVLFTALIIVVVAVAAASSYEAGRIATLQERITTTATTTAYSTSTATTTPSISATTATTTVTTTLTTSETKVSSTSVTEATTKTTISSTKVTTNVTTTTTTTTTKATTGPMFKTGTSWNPRVSCTPIIVRISDITGDATLNASLEASIFNPGITVPSGLPYLSLARRWLTSGATPQGWIAPGPPCTITNSKGQVIGVFVEIDGVRRHKIVNEDYANMYDNINGAGLMPNGVSWPDTTVNIYDPALVPDNDRTCQTPADPTCYGRIHVEIDHDWKAAGYCGAGTACDNGTLLLQTAEFSTLIDVQGFVYWDPEHVTEQKHNFNGWELHPLTAWRLHNSTVKPVSYPAKSNSAQGPEASAAKEPATNLNEAQLRRRERVLNYEVLANLPLRSLVKIAESIQHILRTA